MLNALKQEAEAILGAEISSEEWGEAKERAERKLEKIIEREGDAEGARRKPGYLTLLITEEISAMRWASLSREIMKHDDLEVKKEQPG